MLPERFSPELSAGRNYFGDTFDATAFVDAYASRFESDNREYVARVTSNVLQIVTEAVELRAGQDLSRVDEALGDLFVQTEADLQPDTIAVYVSDIQNDETLRQRMAEKRRVQLLIKKGVVNALLLRRQIEQMPMHQQEQLTHEIIDAVVASTQIPDTLQDQTPSPPQRDVALTVVDRPEPPIIRSGSQPDEGGTVNVDIIAAELNRLRDNFLPPEGQ